ncbi:MAG: UbiD family decarboxylase [Chloroflexi bacterium]|nr:UbiD family decarboxylase [Chloroflexota bacterium]
MADDLRGWLAEMEEFGELAKIQGADWNLEIGATSSLNGKRTDCPALLFENIKGYSPSYRIATCTTATSSRIAHIFGLPRHATDMELVTLLRQKLPKWNAEAARYAPLDVKSGPILENVHTGDDVDLFEFPVPQYHERDGGRYIGTGDAVITMDPDTGEINLGTYRVQVHDRNTVGLFIKPGSHGRIHIEKWHAMGKPCPVAISVGHHPLVHRIAATSVDNEYGFMGAIREKPVDVVREEVTGLPMPAQSEIVIAGWCPPGEKRPEGTFGEWMGYYAGEAATAPIVRIERVYHRHDPILVGAPPARPRSENTHCRALMGAAILHNWLEESGIPDVKGVWLSDFGVRLFTVVSIKQRYDGHAKQVALLVAGSRHGDSGSNMMRYVVVVDDDIDPSNIQDVLWAMCTRCEPVEDIDVVRRTWSASLDPMIRKPAKALYNSKAIIDACKPFEWKDEFPKEITVSPDLAARVKEMWGKQVGLL